VETIATDEILHRRSAAISTRRGMANFIHTRIRASTFGVIALVILSFDRCETNFEDKNDLLQP
jgi:hypothetical protein